MATTLMVSNHGAASGDAGYNGTIFGQTFTVPVGFDRLDYVYLRLLRIGSVSGNITVSIYATSGGKPTGSALVSKTLAASSVSTLSIANYQFDFASDLTIVPGTKYAIVISYNGTSLSNTIAWYRDNNSYASGDGYYKYSAGAWTAQGYDYWFEVWGYQSASVPTVTTDALSGATSSAFTVDGNVTSDGGAAVTERGAVYSAVNTTPTTGDSKQTTTGTTGAMNFAITGLLPGTQYYVRCYAINSQGTSYGAVLAITTSSTAPTVTSDSIGSITSIGATAQGTVVSENGEGVTDRGIVWGTSSNPTTADNKVTSGSGPGAFSAMISGLTPNTTYHFRSYAINSIGTSYGTDISFTTLNQIKFWSQSFTAAVNGTVTKIILPAYLFSGSSGNLKVRIYSDSAGSPGSLLYTCPTVVITNTAFANIEITANQAVTNTTVYWIVIEDPLVVGSFEIVLGSNTAGGYAGGAIKYTKASAPSTWINTSHTTDDMAFYVYTQPAITAPYNIDIRSRILKK